MLVSVRNQFIEAFPDNVVNVDLACYHCLQSLEFALATPVSGTSRVLEIHVPAIKASTTSLNSSSVYARQHLIVISLSMKEKKGICICSKSATHHFISVVDRVRGRRGNAELGAHTGIPNHAATFI